MANDFRLRLNEKELGIVKAEFGEFAEWFETEIRLRIARKLGHVPEAADDINEWLNEFRECDFDIAFIKDHTALVKRGLAVRVRQLASHAENLKQQTNDPDLRNQLDARTNETKGILRKIWRHPDPPLQLPKLSDFLTLKVLESERPTELGLSDAFDEKFSILRSQRFFLHDLAYYRWNCELRRQALCVAFIDIDDFKSFNSKHNETTVDTFMLPRFMAALEAHVYGHGRAYRQGGDEYLAIMPNATRETAVAFMRGFQSRISKLNYQSIKERCTVSVGICHVDEDCFLTELEIEEKASAAKKHAKLNGRNCIAVYRDGLYGDDELILADSPQAA